MKVLVCGGRNYYGNEPGHTLVTPLPNRIFTTLTELHQKHRFTHVIHGGASGADTLASKWAQSVGIQDVRCPANWRAHGQAAGAVRNRAMLALKPDMVVAFPGGTGTADMTRAARAAGVPVTEILPSVGNRVGAL